MNYTDRIRELIKDNKIKEAVNVIFQHYSLNQADLNQMVNLYAQIQEIESKYLNGLIDYDLLNRHKSRIRLAILDKIGEIKNISPDPEHENPQSDSINKDIIFECTGNEPGWSLNITPSRILFINDYGEKATIYPQIIHYKGERIYFYRSETLYNSMKSWISITITEEKWKDNMSGIAFDYRVEIIENFKVYLGTGIKKILDA